MAFEITSDTVVKILVRRGLEIERQSTLLTEGELGYSIDLKRLFVGDGYTTGGITVGNKNFGNVSNTNDILSITQPGDFCFSNNILYFKNTDGSFLGTLPVPYVELSDPESVATVDYSSAPFNGIRFGLSGFAPGLTIDYSDNGNGNINNTITKKYSQLTFDARYISLCASSNSWYLGNIFNKQVANNQDATLNVADEIFVNDSNSNPYQVQIYAKDPLGTANSIIQAVSGGMVIKGRNGVGLLNTYNTATSPQLQVANNGQVILGPTLTGQSRTNPGNLVYGVSRFLTAAYFDDDVYIGRLYTNFLSAAQTFTTASSSLSVYTIDSLQETAFIGNGNAASTQNILRVAGNAGVTLRDYLTVKDSNAGDGGIVAINYAPGLNSNYSFSVSGSVGINAPGAFGSGTDRFDVNAGTIALNGTSIVARVNTGSSSDYLYLSGGLRAGQDIIAFYSSDKNLKSNIKPIETPLQKLNQITGVSFDWNAESGHTGSEYGVVAQDVEKVLPLAVTTRDNGYKAVKYDNLIPLLIESIKELNKKIETQEN
jgi:hypothetical protein